MLYEVITSGTTTPIRGIETPLVIAVVITSYSIHYTKLYELLGLYLSEHEGAHHWLSVLTDLHNRGVKDILIACVDGLKGFPEAIESIVITSYSIHYTKLYD